MPHLGKGDQPEIVPLSFEMLPEWRERINKLVAESGGIYKTHEDFIRAAIKWQLRELAKISGKLS